MLAVSIGVIVVVIVILVYGITLYNELVQVKHGVSKAWANIDVILKQRHDELNKLVEVCKQYRDFEQSTLVRIIEARDAAQTARQRQNVGQLGIAEGNLHQGLRRLFALAEAYPDLKTNQTYLQLQKRIAVLESTLADRRELYNETVNINNVRIEQFPDVIVARICGFKSYDLLTFATEELADVDIKQLFG